MATQNESAASDVSEQPAPQGEVEQKESQSSSLADSLLNIAKAEGYDVGDVPARKPEAIASEETPPPEGEDATEDEQEAEEQEAEIKPAATEHKSIEAQIAEAKAKGEKPAWYLTRIAEESEKRRRANSDAETLKADLQAARQEAQAYQQQLQQASAPRPTPQAPLVDIFDEPSLQRVEQSYEKILEFAELNRDGATDVVVGKDKAGNPIKQDFTPEEVAQLRVKADRALRREIPQRRQLLTQRAQMDAQALEIYPEFKDANSPMTQEALAVLKMNPMVQEILGPETLIWIGHALKGREAFLKSRNGNGNGASRTDSTQRIVESATQRKAPTQPKARSFTERRSGADLAQLNKKLEEEGSEDAALEWLNAKTSQRGSAKELKPIGG
jgi:hypothetical protein